jgi:transposase
LRSNHIREPRHADHHDRFGHRQECVSSSWDRHGREGVVRKQLRRGQLLEFFKALPPCLIGMEACATAHYWARELTKLGHKIRLMPAKDVKAYVKRNKNDAADAGAICEAVRRPTMRFMQVKSAEQQSQLMRRCRCWRSTSRSASRARERGSGWTSRAGPHPQASARKSLRSRETI